MSEGNGSNAFRFDRPIKVVFGGEDLVLEPLRGLKAIRAFEEALADEVQSLRGRVEAKLKEGPAGNVEALLERGADQGRLLLLGAPEQITEDLLEASTALERLGALTIICELNNLARFIPFFAPEVLMDLGWRMKQRQAASAGESPQPNSSEPAPAGEISSAN